MTLGQGEQCCSFLLITILSLMTALPVSGIDLSGICPNEPVLINTCLIVRINTYKKDQLQVLLTL